MSLELESAYARIRVLENALASAACELRILSRWREDARSHDLVMDHKERVFEDSEEWERVELVARVAFNAAQKKLCSKKESHEIT